METTVDAGIEFAPRWSKWSNYYVWWIEDQHDNRWAQGACDSEGEARQSAKESADAWSIYRGWDVALLYAHRMKPVHLRVSLPIAA